MPNPIGKKKIYRVRLSKVFEYPACSIDEKNTLRDLHTKAVENFLENASSERYEINDFDITLEAELPFRVKRAAEKENEEKTISKLNLDYLIREIVNAEIEQKYGVLDFEKNPELFEVVSHEGENSNEEIEPEIYIRGDIEDELEEKVKHYYKILRGKFI